MRIAGRAFLIIMAGVVIAGIFFFSFYTLKSREIEKEVLKQENEIFSSFLHQPETINHFLYRLGVFSPDLLSWREATSSAPWQSRDSHTAIAYNDKIWLIGGLNANDYVISPGRVEYAKATHFSDIWVSRDGISWDLITDKAPWEERRSIQAAVFQGKIWVIPGWGPRTGVQSNAWSSQDGINWEPAVVNGPWPQREGHQLAVFDEKLWILGGVNYDIGKTKNDVWYSEDGISWVKAVSQAPWASRWDHEVITFRGKLWLIGGMDLNGNIYSDVWVSGDGINWSLVTNDPPWPARQGHELVVFKDRIWIIGRLNIFSQGGGNNDVWFSDDGIIWQKTETDPLWSGREDHSAVVFQDKIWVLGGMTSDWQWKNDIWYSVF